MGSDYFRLYQSRMGAFLQRPSIDHMLRGTSNQLANRKEEALKNIEVARIQSKLAVSKLIEKS